MKKIHGFVFYIVVLSVWFVSSGCEHAVLESSNNPPVIQQISAAPAEIVTGGLVFLSAEVEDDDGDDLTFSWLSTDGHFIGSGSNLKWNAPYSRGTEMISLEVSDNNGGVALDEIEIRVIAADNNNTSPIISTLTVESDSVIGGEQVALIAEASDTDGDPLTFSWSVSGGKIIGSGASVIWETPLITTAFSDEDVTLIVDDGHSGYAFKIAKIVVKSPFPLPQVVDIIADPEEVDLGGTSQITVQAISNSGSILSYEWRSFGGEISGSGNAITWKAPSGPICCAPGPYEITVKIRNDEGGETETSIIVFVKI